MKHMYFKNPDLLEKENSTTLLLFNVTNGGMVELNEIAKLLWKNTQASFSVDDLEKIIETHCEDIQNLAHDLEVFIEAGIRSNSIAIQPYEKN